MIAWRVLSERFGRVRGRRAAGNLLGTELTVIAEAVRDVDWPRSVTRPSYERRVVPRDVYRGLAESARLADFDPSTQELLYRLYWRASLGDYSYVNRAVGEAIEEVAQFTAENAPGAGAALGRLARFVAGKRRGRRDGRDARGCDPPAQPAAGREEVSDKSAVEVSHRETQGAAAAERKEVPDKSAVKTRPSA